MSSTVKQLTVTCDPPKDKDAFTVGDWVTGVVNLEVTKECHIESLSIKFKGKAEVLWTERHGNTTHVYHSKDKYFSVKHFFVRDPNNQEHNDNEMLLANQNGETYSSNVNPGCHVYPFTFQFPIMDMPRSFKGAAGKIVYLLEAKLSRSMRISTKDTTKISYVPKADYNCHPEFLTPQHESKDKKMKFFNSGTVAMDVDIEKSGFFQGEGMKVIAHIQNNSTREIKPKYCIYAKHSFFAQGRRRLHTKDLVKEVGEPIPPSSEKIVTRIITIPNDMEPSILDCKILKVEHRLRDAAWETCNEYEQLCEVYIHSVISSVRSRCAEMREKVQETEKTGVDRIDDHVRERQREVWTLKKRQDKINHLSLIRDPIQFIREAQRTDLELDPQKHLHASLDQVTHFAALQEDKIKNLSNKEKNDLNVRSKKYLLLKMPRVTETMPSRTKLLASYTSMQMDPNTVGSCLCLSNNNTELSWSGNPQTPPHHQDRFTFYPQALCTKGLEDNHYWEVQWDGGVVEVAVAYKGINRQGSGKDCCFGHNHMSWKLTCSSSACTFWHNSLHRCDLGPVKSCRVGIHLDFKAGTLSFYSVSQELILLHHTQTIFTEPVYPGFSVDLGATLKICSI